jgi:hypothetical protein
MDSIIIEAEVGSDHRLTEPLPPEVPVGRVRLAIEPMPQSATASKSQPLTRQEARAKLLAAGKLVTHIHAPEGTVELSPHERERIWSQFSGGRSIDDLINQDRGEY